MIADINTMRRIEAREKLIGVLEDEIEQLRVRLADEADDASRLHREKIDFFDRALVAEAEVKRLRELVGWVDSWVSNPVGSYSVAALDGLFGMTRDRIAALPPSHREGVDK